MYSPLPVPVNRSTDKSENIPSPRAWSVKIKTKIRGLTTTFIVSCYEYTESACERAFSKKYRIDVVKGWRKVTASVSLLISNYRHNKVCNTFNVNLVIKFANWFCLLNSHLRSIVSFRSWVKRHFYPVLNLDNFQVLNVISDFALSFYKALSVIHTKC